MEVRHSAAIDTERQGRGALPRFPLVIWQKNRGYVPRSDLDTYKAALAAYALGVKPVQPVKIEPDPLVPLKQVAAELGVGRRTIGRRIAEAEAAADNSAKAA
jgi:hypothetical protein